MTKYDLPKKKRNVDNLIITLSSRCNLSCSYCIIKDNKLSLSITKAKIIVDKFLNQTKSKKTIVFYGGEPLIEEEKLCKLIDYIFKKDQNTVMKVITNGTIVNEKLIKFLRGKNVLIGVSIDGDKNTHDKNRKDKNSKGTYNQIIRNLEKIKPDSLLCLMSTNSINGTSGRIRKLIKKGYKIRLDFQRWCKWDNKSLKELKNEIDKIQKDIDKEAIYQKNFVISKIDKCREDQLCLFTDNALYDCYDLPYLLSSQKKSAKKDKKGEFSMTTFEKEKIICLYYDQNLKKLSKKQVENNLKAKNIFSNLKIR